jgi:hypothetical protein
MMGLQRDSPEFSALTNFNARSAEWQKKLDDEEDDVGNIGADLGLCGAKMCVFVAK